MGLSDPCVVFSVLNPVGRLMGAIFFFLPLQLNIIIRATWSEAWEWSDQICVLYEQNAASEKDREKLVRNILSKEL